MKLSSRRRYTRIGRSSNASVIWTPLLHSIILQIPEEGAQSGGWKLSRSGFESEEGEEAVGTNVVDPGTGGGKRAGFWRVLQACGPCPPIIQAGDMGTDALHGL